MRPTGHPSRTDRSPVTDRLAGYPAAPRAAVGSRSGVGPSVADLDGILFDIALGDVDPDEAGSASGALSAVQQLAAGIGSAAVTSVYFAGLSSGGVQHAMILSLWVVIGIVVLCTTIVPLLPKEAAAGEQP